MIVIMLMVMMVIMIMIIMMVMRTFLAVDGFNLNDEHTLEFRANYSVKRLKSPLQNLAELQCQNSTLCDQNRTALLAKCVNPGEFCY